MRNMLYLFLAMIVLGVIGTLFYVKSIEDNNRDLQFEIEKSVSKIDEIKFSSNKTKEQNQHLIRKVDSLEIHCENYSTEIDSLEGVNEFLETSILEHVRSAKAKDALIKQQATQIKQLTKKIVDNFGVIETTTVTTEHRIKK